MIQKREMPDIVDHVRLGTTSKFFYCHRGDSIKPAQTLSNHFTQKRYNLSQKAFYPHKKS